VRDAVGRACRVAELGEHDAGSVEDASTSRRGAILSRRLSRSEALFQRGSCHREASRQRRGIARILAPMVLLVLALDVLFLAVASGVRTLVQRRRTGDSGWRLGRPHSAPEAVARVLMVGGGVLAGVAVLASNAAGPTVFAIGATVAVVSIGFVALAQ